MASSKTKGLFWLTLAALFGFVVYMMSGQKFEAMWKNIGESFKNIGAGGSK